MAEINKLAIILFCVGALSMIAGSVLRRAMAYTTFPDDRSDLRLATSIVMECKNPLGQEEMSPRDRQPWIWILYTGSPEKVGTTCKDIKVSVTFTPEAAPHTEQKYEPLLGGPGSRAGADMCKSQDESTHYLVDMCLDEQKFRTSGDASYLSPGIDFRLWGRFNFKAVNKDGIETCHDAYRCVEGKYKIEASHPVVAIDTMFFLQQVNWQYSGFIGLMTSGGFLCLVCCCCGWFQCFIGLFLSLKGNLPGQARVPALSGGLNAHAQQLQPSSEVSMQVTP